MPLDARDVNDLEIDAVAAASKPQLEELAAAVRANIDPRLAVSVAGDLDPSADRGEPPREHLGARPSFLSSSR